MGEWKWHHSQMGAVHLCAPPEADLLFPGGIVGEVSTGGAGDDALTLFAGEDAVGMPAMWAASSHGDGRCGEWDDEALGGGSGFELEGGGDGACHAKMAAAVADSRVTEPSAGHFSGS